MILMMGAVTQSEDGTEKVSVHQEEVFTVSASQINKAKKKAKKRRMQALRDKDDQDKKKRRKDADKFPGAAPVDEAAMARQDRGAGVNHNRVKTKFGQKMAKRREEVSQICCVLLRSVLLSFFAHFFQ